MAKAVCSGCGEEGMAQGVVVWCHNCGWLDQKPACYWCSAEATHEVAVDWTDHLMVCFQHAKWQGYGPAKELKQKEEAK